MKEVATNSRDSTIAFVMQKSREGVVCEEDSEYCSGLVWYGVRSDNTKMTED